MAGLCVGPGPLACNPSGGGLVSPDADSTFMSKSAGVGASKDPGALFTTVTDSADAPPTAVPSVPADPPSAAEMDEAAEELATEAAATTAARAC